MCVCWIRGVLSEGIALFANTAGGARFRALSQLQRNYDLTQLNQMALKVEYSFSVLLFIKNTKRADFIKNNINMPFSRYEYTISSSTRGNKLS